MVPLPEQDDTTGKDTNRSESTAFLVRMLTLSTTNSGEAMLHSNPKLHKARWQKVGTDGLRSVIKKSKKMWELSVCTYPGCAKIKRKKVDAWFLE